MNPRALQQAAEWFAVLQSGQAGEAEHRAWRRWLERSAEHRQAWARVERISGQFQALSQDATARAAGRGLSGPSMGRRRMLKTLCVAGGAGVLGTLAGPACRDWMADERTAVGEVRALTLADGSQLWLNTDTALDIRVAAEGPHLILRRGELLLESAAEARIHVSARDAELAGSGARMALYQGDGESRVSLYEGALRLSLTARPGVVEEAMPGHELLFDSARLLGSGPAAAGARAWATGVLLADHLRLDDFVAQLGRYRRGYLGCDTRIAGLRVVGAYPLADTDRVLDILAGTLPIRVNRRLPWWVSLEPAAA
ncbi:DUF4880 domain-containing protein [Stutzerimonas azotifigens]|uniref:DUF4880 domain-containing protein n=1 Tax=Stutzerimonas azotifigens TaxID=291995 RepID=UPI000423F0E9|nr:DUF4880 domain-containing protein [Stutzerimonas azotifigens]